MEGRKKKRKNKHELSRKNLLVAARRPWRMRPGKCKSGQSLRLSIQLLPLNPMKLWPPLTTALRRQAKTGTESMQVERLTPKEKELQS